LSGAGDAERPLPDKNALKRGRYTAEEIANRREIAALLQTMRALARAPRERE
jgi:hypothetical protein